MSYVVYIPLVSNFQECVPGCNNGEGVARSSNRKATTEEDKIFRGPSNSATAVFI